MELSRAESFNLNKMFCCLLVKGKNPKGEEVYAYFAIFLHELQKLVEDLKKGGSFNPKTYNAIVLARTVGGVTEPFPELEEFMKEKFQFNSEKVVLELAYEA